MKLKAQKIENQKETSEPSPVSVGAGASFFILKSFLIRSISFLSNFHAYMMGEISMEVRAGDRALP